MNDEELNEEFGDETSDLDLSELDSCIEDDTWSINFHNTGSVEVDVDFYL